MDRIREFVKHLPLREMDGTLLSYEILDEAINHKLNLNAVNNSIRFASYLHRNDIRGGGGILPDNYINHPPKKYGEDYALWLFSRGHNHCLHSSRYSRRSCF